MSDVTFSSQNVTFQVRCDAAVIRKSFLVLPKMWRFSWTSAQMWRFRHIVTSFFWVRLGTSLGLKTWPGSGFQVLGFSIWARNNPEPTQFEFFSNPSSTRCSCKKFGLTDFFPENWGEFASNAEGRVRYVHAHSPKNTQFVRNSDWAWIKPLRCARKLGVFWGVFVCVSMLEPGGAYSEFSWKKWIFSENPYWLWLMASGTRRLAARPIVHVTRLFVWSSSGMYGIRYLTATWPLPQGIRLRLSDWLRYWVGEGEWIVSPDCCPMFQLFYFWRISLLGIKFMICSANTVFCCACIFIAYSPLHNFNWNYGEVSAF